MIKEGWFNDMWYKWVVLKICDIYKWAFVKICDICKWAVVKICDIRKWAVARLYLQLGYCKGM